MSIFFVEFSVQIWKIYHQHISKIVEMKKKKVNFMKKFSAFKVWN